MLFCILMVVFILGVIVCKCWGEAFKHEALGLYLTSIVISLMVFASSLAANKHLSLVLN